MRFTMLLFSLLLSTLYIHPAFDDSWWVSSWGYTQQRHCQQSHLSFLLLTRVLFPGRTTSNGPAGCELGTFSALLNDPRVFHSAGPTRLLCAWDSLGKNTRLGCHALLQGTFPTQGLNPCLLHLPHCRWILYCLSHQGSPKNSLIALKR